MKRIAVIGSSNTDMVIRVDRIPRPGETVLGGDFSLAAGGKGANQAVAAARAGGAVTFLGRVGDDRFGRQALAGFKRDGISVRHVIRDPGAPSGVALICVDGAGQNSIAVASGANARLSPADIAACGKTIAGAGIVLMQLETPLAAVAAAARIASRAGVPVILNPAPARPLPPDLLKNVSILTPNETEAELLAGIKVAGEASARRAARSLVQKGAQAAVITLGAGGAFIYSGEYCGRIPAFRVAAVDTTAAGDTFAGALAVGLVEGKPLPEAVRFANAAAALSVTRPGAQPSCPRRREIETFRQRKG